MLQVSLGANFPPDLRPQTFQWVFGAGKPGHNNDQQYPPQKVFLESPTLSLSLSQKRSGKEWKIIDSDPIIITRLQRLPGCNSNDVIVHQLGTFENGKVPQ